MKRTETAAPSVTLVPMGPLPEDLLAWLREHLVQALRRPVAIGKVLALPRESYNPQKQQYLGERILAALRRLPLPEGGQAVGLADADCYTPGMSFVFGQAVRGGRVAFVALPRLRPSFYGLPHEEDQFRERVLKEVVHELGHTWSLAHCPSVRCVMHFSNTLQDTDAKGVDFCAHCCNRLGRPQRP